MVECEECGKDTVTFYEYDGKKICLSCFSDVADLNKIEKKRKKKIKKDAPVLSFDILEDINSKLFRIDNNLNFITLYLKITIILGIIGFIIFLIVIS